MIPRKKTKADRGFRFVREWFNELRGALMRSRVIVEKGSGFRQTPTGVLPPPLSPEYLPPLHPALFDDGGQWKWTIYPGHVIARDLNGDNVLKRHVPQINGVDVTANSPRENAVDLGVNDQYIYLEITYADSALWQSVESAEFIASATTLSSTEFVERVLWAEIATETGAYKHIDYTNALNGHFFANRGDGLRRLIGQVRDDGAGGWEYRVTEGTVEETGSNNAVQVSKAWAASPATKTFVWVEILYATAVTGLEWHLRMTSASIQTGAAWGVGGTGTRIVPLFAVKNNEITDISWEGDYTWCEPFEDGTDSTELFDTLKVVTVTDADCIGLERVTVKINVDFGQRTVTRTVTPTGEITEVKKCSAT